MCLLGWNQLDHSINKKVPCTGGWIEIEDLPLKWWTKDIFEAIGEKCRGLIQIDYRTENMLQLFKAIIKIKGTATGFIPAEIDMEIGEDEFTIKLRAISRLNVRNRGCEKTVPGLDNFSRCTISLAGEDYESEIGKEKVKEGDMCGTKELEVGSGAETVGSRKGKFDILCTSSPKHHKKGFVGSVLTNKNFARLDKDLNCKGPDNRKVIEKIGSDEDEMK